MDELLTGNIIPYGCSADCGTVIRNDCQWTTHLFPFTERLWIRINTYAETAEVTYYVGSPADIERDILGQMEGWMPEDFTVTGDPIPLSMPDLREFLSL